MTTEVGDLSRVEVLKHHHAIALLESEAKAGEETVFVLATDRQLVRLDFDAMELVAVELHPVGDLS